MQRVESQHAKRIVRAVIFGIVAALCSSIAGLLVKLVASSTTASVTVLFRCIVGSIWLTFVLLFRYARGQQVTLKTHRFGLHFLRATCGFIAILSFNYTLQHAPIADTSSLAKTYAIFVPILGFIFLGTKTNIKNWLAIVLGFVGVIFIVKPFSSDFNPTSLLAIVTGITHASALLCIHELTKTDKPYAILFYLFSLTLLISMISSAFNWITPDLPTFVRLLLIGAIEVVYQEFLTRSLLYGTPKIIAPILYLTVVFGGTFDWLFWAHIPSIFFWIGTLLIATGCFFSVRYAKT